jgi:hypothetical protein
VCGAGALYVYYKLFLSWFKRKKSGEEPERLYGFTDWATMLAIFALLALFASGLVFVILSLFGEGSWYNKPGTLFILVLWGCFCCYIEPDR